MKSSVFFAASLLFAGLTLFYVGYHNADTSVNMIRLGYMFNTTFYDTTLGGHTVYPEESYRQGMYYMMIGFVITFIAGMQLGQIESKIPNWDLGTKKPLLERIRKYFHIY